MQIERFVSCHFHVGTRQPSVERFNRCFSPERFQYLSRSVEPREESCYEPFSFGSLDLMINILFEWQIV